MTQPIYSERGGSKIGRSFLLSINSSWPLAKIEIYMECVILKVFPFIKIKFEKHEIKHFEKMNAVVLGSVKIVHNKPNTSKYIVFWTFGLNKLIEKLKMAGYKVKE